MKSIRVLLILCLSLAVFSVAVKSAGAANPGYQGKSERECRKTIKPYQGAKNGQLTAKQQRALAECMGISAGNSVKRDEPYSVPANTQLTPSSISCDNTGCWDNLGMRYNKAAGSTYIRSDGKACQMAGNMMHCP